MKLLDVTVIEGQSAYLNRKHNFNLIAFICLKTCAKCLLHTKHIIGTENMDRYKHIDKYLCLISETFTKSQLQGRHSDYAQMGSRTHRHWATCSWSFGNLKAEPGVLSLDFLLATPPIFGSKPLLDEGQKNFLFSGFLALEVLLTALEVFLAEDD